MKLLKVKFKIIIGIVIFILLVCAGYSAKLHTSSGINKSEVKIGEKVYNGIFITPVENFITVTSKYGGRIHPITRKTKLSYRNRFSGK